MCVPLQNTVVRVLIAVRWELGWTGRRCNEVRLSTLRHEMPSRSRLHAHDLDEKHWRVSHGEIWNFVIFWVADVCHLEWIIRIVSFPVRAPTN
jgi:hypothetical protein